MGQDDAKTAGKPKIIHRSGRNQGGETKSRDESRKGQLPPKGVGFKTKRPRVELEFMLHRGERKSPDSEKSRNSKTVSRSPQIWGGCGQDEKKKKNPSIKSGNR